MFTRQQPQESLHAPQRATNSQDRGTGEPPLTTLTTGPQREVAPEGQFIQIERPQQHLFLYLGKLRLQVIKQWIPTAFNCFNLVVAPKC